VSERNAYNVLRKLVDLAGKANSSKTAMRMDDIFDDPKDAEEWKNAWTEAQAIVYKLS